MTDSSHLYDDAFYGSPTAALDVKERLRTREINAREERSFEQWLKIYQRGKELCQRHIGWEMWQAHRSLHTIWERTPGLDKSLAAEKARVASLEELIVARANRVAAGRNYIGGSQVGCTQSPGGHRHRKHGVEKAHALNTDVGPEKGFYRQPDFVRRSQHVVRTLARLNLRQQQRRQKQEIMRERLFKLSQPVIVRARVILKGHPDIDANQYLNELEDYILMLDRGTTSQMEKQALCQDGGVEANNGGSPVTEHILRTGSSDNKSEVFPTLLTTSVERLSTDITNTDNCTDVSRNNKNSSRVNCKDKVDISKHNQKANCDDTSGVSQLSREQVNEITDNVTSGTNNYTDNKRKDGTAVTSFSETSRILTEYPSKARTEHVSWNIARLARTSMKNNGRLILPPLQTPATEQQNDYTATPESSNKNMLKIKLKKLSNTNKINRAFDNNNKAAVTHRKVAVFHKGISASENTTERTTFGLKGSSDVSNPAQEYNKSHDFEYQQRNIRRDKMDRSGAIILNKDITDINDNVPSVSGKRSDTSNYNSSSINDKRSDSSNYNSTRFKHNRSGTSNYNATSINDKRGDTYNYNSTSINNKRSDSSNYNSTRIKHNRSGTSNYNATSINDKRGDTSNYNSTSINDKRSDSSDHNSTSVNDKRSDTSNYNSTRTKYNISDTSNYSSTSIKNNRSDTSSDYSTTSDKEK